MQQHKPLTRRATLAGTILAIAFTLCHSPQICATDFDIPRNTSGSGEADEFLRQAYETPQISPDEILRQSRNMPPQVRAAA